MPELPVQNGSDSWVSLSHFRPTLAFLGHFDGAIVRIDLDPIAGFDDLQRIPIEIGYGRGVGVTTAPRAILVVISLKSMAAGAAPASRAIWN